MPPEELDTRPVEVTCPGCFHPQQWDATAACPICHHRANAEGRSGALLPVGTQLKGYLIGEKLGQGGFGITYRGFDLTLKMKVAIKEYYPSELVGRSTNRKAVVLNGHDHEEIFSYGLKTFLQEAQTIAQLRHPHLVRVLNYFELNDTAYLVMDYYEGEDLAKHLKPPRRGQPGIRLPWQRAVKLLLPVLDGLQKVHQIGFMHRDLKPGNLYLTKDDELIVLDFGSARQVTSNHSRSLLIFSQGYAPYEQYLEGHLSRQGPWTDVYAIAATLYFMLTACRLSAAMDRKQAALLQQPDPLKPARQLVPELPLALDAALIRALAVEPEQRLQSVAEFKKQLESALAEPEPSPTPPELPTLPHAKPPPEVKPLPEPKVAPEPPPRTTPALRATPPLPRRGTSRNLTWIAIVAIMVVGLVAGGGLWFTDQRFTDSGDGTITDNQTGLVWLKNANCFGYKDWLIAMDLAGRLKNGQCNLSDGSVAGQWRLPSKEEWETLLDKNARNPALNPALPVGYPFTGVQSNAYWSSTTSYAPYPSSAWSVFLYGGVVNAVDKTTANYVWPVRGGR